MGRGRKSSYGVGIRGFELSTISVLPSSGYLLRHPYAQVTVLHIMGGCGKFGLSKFGFGVAVMIEVSWRSQHGYCRKPKTFYIRPINTRKYKHLPPSSADIKNGLTKPQLPDMLSWHEQDGQEWHCFYLHILFCVPRQTNSGLGRINFRFFLENTHY